METPSLPDSLAIFSFAKAIPGSYAQKDFGRFIDNFAAYDRDGKLCQWEKLNTNQYRIHNTQNLRKIVYQVNDTWDDKRDGFIFQPGGSNIEAGKNLVINSHAFIGYFEQLNAIPFELTVKKPANFFGATHLPIRKASAEVDVLAAENFFKLADDPIIYAPADTTSFSVGKSRINVSVYSATGKVKSAQIAEYLKPMSKALEVFFNGLPVDSYNFLFYFEDPKKALVSSDIEGSGYGALEHNYSSLYYLPETALEPRLKSMVNEVSSHEFLHILTPLNLHSQEIENFDFTNPKMSKHLWLYEGVTEYFANLVQLQNDLLTEKDFFKNMRDKVNQAEEYGNFSMTEMSTKVMEPKYHKKYNSVYSKGALIAFFLDLTIREKTKGKSDLKTVITALAQKYGPNKPFVDDELLAEIIKLSDPEVADFITKYIEGNLPLPLNKYFNKVGYDYLYDKKEEVYYAGRIGVKLDDSTNNFVFTDVEDNSLKIENGDVLFEINDIVVKPENFESLWQKYFDSNTEYPELNLVVIRNNIKTLLSGKLHKGSYRVKNYLRSMVNKNEDQINMLKSIKYQNQ